MSLRDRDGESWSQGTSYQFFQMIEAADSFL